MKGTDRQGVEEIAAELAELLERSGPLEAADAALEMARQALELITPEQDPALWADLHLTIGRIGTIAGYDREDLAMLRGAVEANAAALLVCEGEADPIWFLAEHTRALGLIYLGRLSDDPQPMSEAAERLRAMLRILPRDAPQGRWASCMNALGTALMNVGGTRGQVRPARRATACYRTAARAYAAGGYLEDARNSTYNQGLACIVLGDLSGDPKAYDRAIAIFETVRANASPERDLRDWAKVSDAIARARANRGEVTGDAAAIAEAVAECVAIQAAMPRALHPGWWAMVMVSLCDFRLRLAGLRGEPAGLLAAAEGALEAVEVARVDTMPAYWTSLMRTAAKARLQLGTQMGDPAQVEQAIALAGDVIEARSCGPREQAAVLALRGLAALRLVELCPDEGGEVLAGALDDLDAALRQTDRAAAPGLWAGIALSRAEAHALTGKRARGSAQLAMAVEDYKAVLAALPETEASPRRGEALAGIAHARLARAAVHGDGDALGIAADFRVAQNHLREDLDPAAVIEAGCGRAAALLLAARWAEAAAEAGAQIDRAAALIAAEPTEHGRLRLAEALAGTGDIGAYAELRLGRVDRALALHERGRAHRLRARLRVAEAALDAPRAAEINRLRRRADLARRALAQSIEYDRPAAAVARLAAALEREHTRLISTMAEAGLSATGDAPTLAILRGLMADGVVALPVVTPAGGALLVLGGAGTGIATETLWLDRLKTQAVEDMLADADGGGWLGAFAAFRGALAEARGPGGPAAVAAFQTAVARAARDCWTLLMGPLDAHLRRRGLERGSEVALIPGGRLSALPLHAAGSGGQTFLDHWAVSYSPSLAAFAACRRRASARRGGEGRLLAVTDPGLDLGRLVNPATVAVPADRVDALHGPAATRAAVTDALPGATYVSFFSHATWDPEHPERSALRLAGGERLAAEDFAMLDLERCRMVVLGACESGVPGLRIAADEFRGMPAALLEAGIPGVMATLWPVFTDAADRIIAAFFRHHLAEGLAPAQALRRAQMALRADGAAATGAVAMGLRRGGGSESPAPPLPGHDLSLPAHWAAFAYIGA